MSGGSRGIECLTCHARSAHRFQPADSTCSQRGCHLTEEIEIKLDLADRRNELADLRRANRSDRREAATSELTLVLHTKEAPAAREDDEGGVAGAADDALRFLGGATNRCIPKPFGVEDVRSTVSAFFKEQP